MRFPFSNRSGNPLRELRRKKLRLSFSHPVTVLDPRRRCDRLSAQFQRMVFEGLLTMDGDKRLRLGQAGGYSISAAGHRYTFYLRQNLWSDNTAVRAQEFEQAWKSLLDPQQAFPAASLLAGIKNGQRAQRGEVPLSEVGIYSYDAATLVVDFEHPSRYFLRQIACRGLMPIHSQALLEYGKNPLGLLPLPITNGPFRVASWIKDQQIVLQKNRHYWNCKQCKIETIEIWRVENASFKSAFATLRMFVVGVIDLMGGALGDIPRRYLPPLQRAGLIRHSPRSGICFLAFNTAALPLSNRYVRQALALAVDRRKLIAIVDGSAAELATTFLPDQDPLPRHPLAQVRLTRAKRYLAIGLRQLGISKIELGPLLLIYHAGSEMQEALAIAMEEDWQHLGLTVHRHGRYWEEEQAAGDHDILLGSHFFAAGIDDLTHFLQQLEGANSNSRWQNGAYAELISAALQRVDRHALLLAADRLLAAEVPATPLFCSGDAFLLQPWLQHFALLGDGLVDFSRLALGPRRQEGQ